jgi:WD40 repeat protein
MSFWYIFYIQIHTSTVVGNRRPRNNGQYILEGDENTIHLIDFDSGQLLRKYIGGQDVVNVYSFECCLRLDIALAEGKDNIARVWRLSTGEPLTVLAGHTDEIVDMAYTDTLYVCTLSFLSNLRRIGWQRAVRT